MVTTQKPEGAGGPSASANSRADKRSTENEKLGRAWRSLVSSIIVTTRAADKVTARADGNTKELEEAVDQTLRARNDVRRYVTSIEANLMGQAKETEALDGLLQSQPRMGRKRKRAQDNGAIKDS